MENRFNLIDEPWIPIADQGRVSLKQIFTETKYRSLGGNPVQKIALLKLLLAIAQAAATPKDEQEWQALGAEGLAKRCLAYLDKWHDHFYLYGDKPFLQMPQILNLIKVRTTKKLAGATTKSKIDDANLSGVPKGFGAGFYPDLPSNNNTFLSHTLQKKTLSDADKAVFLISVMNFALGGKRVEADMVSLGGAVLGNKYSAKAGPSIGGYVGYLHNFIFTGSVLSDLWLNLLSHKIIGSTGMWSEGLGRPIWENMPESEGDGTANDYKKTYFSVLVALSRFVLLSGEGVYYMDGLNYPSTKDGWFEPSLILNRTGKEIKTKYVDPERRPWRELVGLLSFIAADTSSGFESLGLKISIERARDNLPLIAVWSGGLKVTGNSGDQSVKQSDDFVESVIWIDSENLGTSWFSQLKQEMDTLEQLAKNLYGCVINYMNKQSIDTSTQSSKGRLIAAQTTQLFWQLCERDFQTLVDNCEPSEETNQERHKLRRKLSNYQQQAYDFYCPKATARQLDSWVQHRPNNFKYLAKEA